MTPLELGTTVTYSLPLGDLVALGKALYVANDEYLQHEGITADAVAAVQRAFDALDESLARFVGPDWLGTLEDEPAERGVFPEVVAKVTPMTPFAALVRSMK